MSDNTTGNMVTLMSKDGEGFMVTETVAKKSQIICHILEDISDTNFILLPNVYAPTLALVIEYCKKHVDASAASSRISDEELRNWDKQFSDVDMATLFNLLMAADYLHIKGLLDLTCQKGKGPVEIFAKPSTLKTTSHPKRKKRFGMNSNGLLSDEKY